MWFILAAVCVYAIGYRFYSAFIAAKVLALDPTRATPAERFSDGRDFVPTNRWVVFGHHFAAIAGPGPLVGPTLAAQFGYLPGTLWILFGAVLGGCVQDFVALFCSIRRDGRSLGQMARDELGAIGGAVALIGVLAIMIISDRRARARRRQRDAPQPVGHVHGRGDDSDRDLSIGLFMRHLRPGRVLEGTAIGVVLLLLAVFGGSWVDAQPGAARLVRLRRPGTGVMVILYGFAAAVLPVWLLLAPRDYLSTFMKIGTIVALAVAIVVLEPGREDAGRHAVRRRHGPDLRRQGVSVRVHHDRVRRDLGFPRADLLRHHAEAARERARRALHRLRRDGGGVVRRDHGDDRRVRARSRRLSSRSTARRASSARRRRTPRSPRSSAWGFP